MLARIALAATLLALAAAAPAGAASLGVQDGVLTYVAEPGEHNEVDVYSDSAVSGLVYVYEYTADITPGPGCVPAPDPFALQFVVVFLTFNCTGVTSVDVELGDGNDYAGIITDPQPGRVDAGEGDDFVFGSYVDDELIGGPGKDEMQGGPGSDRLVGGDGNDTLDGDFLLVTFDGEDMTLSETGEGGDDTLDGGAGDDVLRGGVGTDALSGGPGLDAVDYGARADAVSVSLDGAANDGGPGENDAVTDVENVLTGAGNDVIAGSAGANTITTGLGDDTVTAGGGADKVSTGAGTDTIDLQDGAADGAECGEGLPDRVRADGLDITGADCEIVERPHGVSGPGTGAKPVPARLSVRVTRVRRGRHGLIAVRGRLTPPAGLPTSTCSGSTVRVTVKVARRSFAVDVPMDRACRFTAAVPARVARRAQVRAGASFAGNVALGAITSRRR